MRQHSETQAGEASLASQQRSRPAPRKQKGSGARIGVVLAAVMTAAVASASTAEASVRLPSATDYFCGLPVVKNYIPACSNGKWEPRQIKLMRCIAGHTPYSGALGVGKFTYWLQKCARTDWEKW